MPVDSPTVFFLTGSSRGLGRAIAEAVLDAGHQLVATARNPESLDDLLAAHPDDVLPLALDVTDAAAAEAAIAAGRERFGRIDVVVNNAGGFPPMAFLDTDLPSWEWCFKFNLTSAYLLTRTCLPIMLEHDGGAVLNISSAAGRIVQKGFVAYGTAKAALSFMTRQLAAEFAPRVRVNALSVGAVETSALAPFLSDDLRAQMESMTPMRRIGSVEDIAAAALWLCSPAGGWVTGKVVEVDGGTEKTNWPFE